jgi:hypothetical protein
MQPGRSVLPVRSRRVMERRYLFLKSRSALIASPGSEAYGMADNSRLALAAKNSFVSGMSRVSRAEASSRGWAIE